MVKKLLFYLMVVLCLQKSEAQTVDLLAPIGFENWAVGSVQSIQWSYSNVNFIRIEYSVDGGVNYSVLIGNTLASNQVFYWTIPSNISTNCIVKITDVTSGVTSQSQNPFTILVGPFINIITPNGGEVLIPGMDTLLTWSDQLISPDVKIEYSIDDGLNWILIVDFYPNTQSYLWTIPNTPSNVCRVKISDNQNNSVSDISANTFFITPPLSPIQLFAPNGGDQWVIGYQQNIFWSASTITNLKIEISFDLGVNWTVLDNSFPAVDGYYTWLVTASSATSNALVKLSDAQNPTIFDLSDLPFELIMPPASLTLIYPNGGEQLATGLPINITWNAPGVNSINIEYSANNGLSWNNIEPNALAAGGTYSWLVPNIIGDSVLIKLSDVNNSAVTDQSTSIFSIVEPDIEFINFPNAITYDIYTNLNLYWTGVGINNQLINIEYSTNNGSIWVPIASNILNTGAFTWLINCPPTDSCKFKISLQNNPSIFTISPGAIHVVANSPALVVLTPGSQEILGAGTTYPITWYSYAINYVRIEYSLNGDTIFYLITPLAPAINGVYYWNVPSNINAINCKIRISNAANTSLNSENPNVFSIENGFYEVTSGNTNNNIVVGLNHPITWTHGGVSNYVNIDYSIDSLNWIPIISNYPNTGIYNWSVIFINSDSLWYRVSDAANNSTFDINNVPQNVQLGNSIIDIIAPNSGNLFSTNASFNLTWQAMGIDFVKIEYSIDAGTNWINIVTNYNASIENYSWTTPNSIINNGIIRISSLNNSLLFDQIEFSTANPFLTLSIPNGGENWITTNMHYITWQSVGVNYVNLYYSANNGSNWIAIDSNLSNIGYYHWLTPSSIGNNFKIKVENSDSQTMVDESNAAFNLTTPNAAISLIAPNGGEQIIIGTGTYIDWQSTNISNIDILYSLDGGINYITIATNIPSIPSFYFWQVPDTLTNAVKIKITKAGSASISDFSATNFSIISNLSSLQLITPNGGEVFNANSYKTIKWQSNNCNFVKIYYSIDGGTSYSFINSIIGDTVFIWNVPINVSANCKIKIENGNDNSVNDITTGLFEIINILTVNNGITISALTSNIICSGSSFNLNYTLNNNFNATNNFRVHLSNSSGTFSSFTDIGGISSNLGGSILCYIPTEFASGTNYTVRIVADNPPETSSNYNFGSITINKANADFVSDKILTLLPNANVLFTPISNSNLINTSNWTISNGDTYNTYSPQCQLNQPGKYDVTLNISDTLGCSASVLKQKMIYAEHLFYAMELTTPNQNEIVDIAFENEVYGCAIFKNGNCIVTADSGKNWSLTYTGSNNVQLNSITIRNNNWLIAMENGSYLKSTNKGNTWSQFSFNNSVSLKDIIYTSSTNAIAVGASGKVFKFNGTIWQNQISGTNKTLNKIHKKNSTTIIVGNNGSILKLQNNVWSTIQSPINTNLNDVTFKDSLNGFIASDFGYILKTTDAGLTWTVSLSGADVNFKNITCSGDSVWAVGTSGAVYTSIDNGTNWNRFSIGALNQLNGIVYFNDKGFICGDNGLLKSFNNKVYAPFVDQIKEAQKNTFIKCYPNPTADYIIASINDTNLKTKYTIIITDIQGKQYFQNQTTGSNPNYIDLRNYNDGIYLLTIRSEEIYKTFKIVKTK